MTSEGLDQSIKAAILTQKNCKKAFISDQPTRTYPEREVYLDNEDLSIPWTTKRTIVGGQSLL